jgi:hypothetical protein
MNPEPATAQGVGSGAFENGALGLRHETSRSGNDQERSLADDRGRLT